MSSILKGQYLPPTMRPVEARGRLRSRETTPSIDQTAGRRISVWALLALITMIAIATPYTPTYTRLDEDPEAKAAKAEMAMEAIETGALPKRISLAIFGVAGIILMSQGVRRPGMRTALAWSTTAFGVLAVVSPLWSDDPSLTVRRLGVLILFNLGALGLVCRWSASQVLDFAFKSSLVTLIAGFLTEIVRHNFHPLDSAYRFEGLAHPNSMGAVGAVMLIAAAVRLRQADPARFWNWVGLGIGLATLALTKSRGALVGAMAGAGVCLLMTMPRRRIVFWGMALGALALALLIFLPSTMDHLQHAFLMGRADSEAETLSGRTVLWKYLLGYIEARRWFGYAFSSFWTPVRVFTVSQDNGWTILHSHSEYIEVALQLGVIGLGLYILTWLMALARATARLIRGASPDLLFTLALSTWLVIHTLIEPLFLRPSLPALAATLVLLQLAFIDEPASGPQVIPELEGAGQQVPLQRVSVA